MSTCPSGAESLLAPLVKARLSATRRDGMGTSIGALNALVIVRRPLFVASVVRNRSCLQPSQFPRLQLLLHGNAWVAAGKAGVSSEGMSAGRLVADDDGSAPSGLMFSSLNSDVLLHVLVFLPASEVVHSVRTTCRRLDSLCTSNRLWLRLYLRDIGHLPACALMGSPMEEPPVAAGKNRARLVRGSAWSPSILEQYMAWMDSGCHRAPCFRGSLGRSGVLSRTTPSFGVSEMSAAPSSRFRLGIAASFQLLRGQNIPQSFVLPSLCSSSGSAPAPAGSVMVFDGSRLLLLDSISNESDGRVFQFSRRRLAVCGHKRGILALGADGSVERFDFVAPVAGDGDGESWLRLCWTSEPEAAALDHRVMDLAVLENPPPPQQLVLLFDSGRGTVRILSLRSGACVGLIRMGVTGRSQRQTERLSVPFLCVWRSLVVCCFLGRLFTISRQRGDPEEAPLSDPVEIFQLPPGMSRCLSLAVSSTGVALVEYTNDASSFVSAVDLTTCRLRWTLKNRFQPLPVQCLETGHSCIDANGRMAYICGPSAVSEVDLDTGRVLLEMPLALSKSYRRTGIANPVICGDLLFAVAGEEVETTGLACQFSLVVLSTAQESDRQMSQGEVQCRSAAVFSFSPVLTEEGPFPQLLVVPGRPGGEIVFSSRHEVYILSEHPSCPLPRR